MEKIKKIFGNEIFCGDSLEVMKALPSKCCNLVFTSPPYPGFRTFVEDDKRDISQRTPAEFVDDFLPYVIEIERLLRHEEGGTFILNLGEKYEEGFASCYPVKLMLNIIKNTKFKLVDDCTWIKSDPFPGKRSQIGTLAKEHVFIFGTSKKITKNDIYLKHPYRSSRLSISKKKRGSVKRKQTGDFIDEAKCFDNIGAEPSNYICTSEYEKELTEEKKELEERLLEIKDIMLNKKDPTSFITCSTQNVIRSNHSAQMPLPLAEYFVGGYSKENSIVLDPFGGCGTTILAAKKLNRKYIYIDLNKEECKKAREVVKSNKDKADLFNYFGLKENVRSTYSELTCEKKQGKLF